MNKNSGLYKGGLIVNIVFSSLSFFIVLVVGLTETQLSMIWYFFVLGCGICLIQIIISSVALHLISDTKRKRTRGFGIASGVIGIFTTPFFLGGILTLIGVSLLDRDLNLGRYHQPPSTKVDTTAEEVGYVPRDTGN